jgi:thiamine-phosphate pyrophosphorylase
MNLSLYLVTDASLSRGRGNRQVVEAAIRGGVTAVQYRDKTASTRRMIEEASALYGICRAAGVIFIVNDRVDVALAVGADGVHVGQGDMPAPLARELIGPDRILGVSVGSVGEALRAAADGADYVGASPIFATPTKPDAPRPMGLEGLRAVAGAAAIPVVAIGGVNEDNVEALMRCGASGLAVVSAIVAASDVEGATKRLRALIEATGEIPGATEKERT